VSGSGPAAGIADFLGSRPPFDAVGADDLARVAAVTETDVSRRGATIFPQGAGPVEYLRMVRDGVVEVRHDGRILDLLGPGELFGQASMISGLPTGFEARAGQDTVCYRIPAEVVRPLLARPDVLRFVARSIVARSGPPAEPAGPPDLGQRQVAALIRTPPLLCPPGEPIREAARRMTAAGVSAVLVRTGGGLGIVTDQDFRSRVVAAGVNPDGPVSAIMTEPAYTVTAGRLAAEVLLDMLERNIHHVPVLSVAGEVLGVVDDGDLMSAQARQPFLLRRAIALAASPAEVADAAAGLGPMIVALRDARVAAEQVAAVRSVVLDALIRRLAELAVAAAGDPPAPFTWFALGSLARREAVPSSDVDSALAWQDAEQPGAGVAAEAAGTAAGEATAEAAGTAAGEATAGAAPEVRDYLARVANAVQDGLRACGLRPDAHGASAANPLFARSLASWRAAARRLGQDPTQEQALILVSVLTDSRPVWDSGRGAPAADALWTAGDQLDQADLKRLLAQFALSFRPPTGFLRDFVVEHSGERRGQLDLKHGGLIPIVDLARWAALGAGVTGASTLDRLRAAQAAGTLADPEASTLIEAFGFIFSLRLDHQVEQLRGGEAPDDFIDPKKLNPLARSYLREAFRAVASVQAGLANELSLGARWG
jgi:CBS domain-containing protein